jgi:hypothetical protein
MNTFSSDALTSILLPQITPFLAFRAARLFLSQEILVQGVGGCWGPQVR